ncbi:MAG: glycosyltransferase [Chitinophagaceae bacterium]
MRVSKPVVVVMYEYFFPGYRAGGPIRSLVNMITALQADYECKVITTAYDLNGDQPYPGIETDAWNEVRPGRDSQPVKVWYASQKKLGITQLRTILKQANPDIIFINGLFTQWFAGPLWLKRTGRAGRAKIVVSPRGMLQPGALQVKPLKKKIYLSLFKWAGLFKGVAWHATTADEQADIRREMGANAEVAVAPNIPVRPVAVLSYPDKQAGQLRLVYLSIITEKKNLLLLLQSLQDMSENIILSVYGPVKEESYWQSCRQMIGRLPANITVEYRGDVQPEQVQQVLQDHHAFISLTRGENFGHALYESLAAGRPVITSRFTPWNGLEQQQAGLNVDIADRQAIQAAIRHLWAMDPAGYVPYCEGAHRLAGDYFYGQKFREDYRRLFTI